MTCMIFIYQLPFCSAPDNQGPPRREHGPRRWTGTLNDSEEQEALEIFILSELFSVFLSLHKSNLDGTNHPEFCGCM